MNGQNPELSQAAIMETLFSYVGADCKGKEEGDYLNDDGLLVCHVCGKPKQKRVDLPILGIRVHPIMCECQIMAEKRKEQEEIIRRELEILNELKRYSIIDNRFMESTFENCKLNDSNIKQVTIAKNYVKKFDEMYLRNKGLLFFGEPGTGKTFVASCIANELLKRRVPVIVTSIIKLTGSSSPFSREAEETQSLIQRMNVAKLIVLDDLGSERSTDYKLEQVFDLIDSRYAAKKPMVITTNMSIEQMMNETDIRKKRIYERIYEVCFPVMFTGRSWRYTTAQNDYEEIKDILLK